MRFVTHLLLFLIFPAIASAQLLTARTYTKADTLRGSLTPERAWWDVLHYDITVEPDTLHHSIRGKNTISFRVTGRNSVMQLDLQQPMTIDSIQYNRQKLSFVRDGNVFYVKFPAVLPVNSTEKITAFFSGKPKVARNAPWDGGWIWKKDQLGRQWISVACQGLGASVWYPNKDQQADEVDSASLTIVVPPALTGVGNGRLRSETTDARGWKHYQWVVVNPINNYNIVPYIGYYTHFGEVLNGEKGPLDCNYWVLDYNLEKAKLQFAQVKPMIKCFEHWFGPYPFYEDGYKLVESPHLGMEHQSAVAYGNGYQDGYLGRDLSGTGWGLKFDFIIIHESGHEWFGNSITSKDIADMWIHESFTNYSEAVYLNCQYGDSAMNAYVQGVRKNIRNDEPIIGPYNVNKEGSGDMYYKGANMIHIIKQLIGDEEKFRQLLRGINSTFYHQTVTTQQIEEYIIKETGLDLQKVFDQYLRTTQEPRLLLEIVPINNRTLLSYQWTDCVPGFNMKTRIQVAPGNWIWIQPTDKLPETPLDLTGIYKEAIPVKDPNFYIR